MIVFHNNLFNHQDTTTEHIIGDYLYGGRPHYEPPHVKKCMKKHGEKVDLILRVDLVSSTIVTAPAKKIMVPFLGRTRDFRR